MISQVSNSAVFSAYSNNLGDTKESSQKLSVSKQGDMSKIDRIKDSIGSGEYKINLEALSEKIANELL
jgi:anti-sigma28 factor (negative regulator of flagellin synthesis)